MKFSDEQRKFIILQFAKGLTEVAVKRNFLKTFAIWGKQRSKFTLTDFQREWQRFQDGPLGRLGTEVVDQRFEIKINRKLRHTKKTTPNQASERHQGHLISLQPVSSRF